jgi:diacylglycerol kinase (ATP)
LNPEPDTRPDSTRSFALRTRIESFGHAFRGIAGVIRSEHNAWIHAFATLVTIILAIGLDIDRGEWLAVVLAIAMVWSAEALNTAVEMLCDVVSPDHDPRVKKAKDAAAGAVLLSAMGALVVGILIFLPRLLLLIAAAPID